MFESFNVPALYIASSAVLALYGTGRTSGMVLESGDRLTHCVPVYEGHALPYATIRLELGGHDLTDFLVNLLEDRGYSFTTKAEREIARDIKEKHCYVCRNFEKERVNQVGQTKSYELPDGQVISLEEERFVSPEALFQPRLLGLDRAGVHEAVCDSIKRCDSTLQDTLFSNIILAGGNTMFQGITERLKHELAGIVPTQRKVRVYAAPERKLSSWIGASIFSSLSSFLKMAIRKEEYDEVGPTIVHQKCF